VFCDDLGLAVKDFLPIQLALSQALDAVVFRMLEVVVDLRVEEERLGRNAADVKAGASQLRFFLNHGGFETILPGANGGRISGGPSADDGYVVDGFCQCRTPFDE
jgi:hypothetical protein